MSGVDAPVSLWFVLVGALLVGLALSSTVLQRLPLTAALLYLAVGAAIGPLGLGMIRADPMAESLLLERLTEVVVIVSLFSAGLKLRTPLDDRRWIVPVRLAAGSMGLTIGLVTLAGVYLLGLPLGAAVLLGAILAPTDPVLASDVQVAEPRDQDRLRFGLTGEAGLNDGTAFPFVMLGLGLLGVHELGDNGWRWLVVDVLWAVPAGLAIGAVLGTMVGRLIVYLRRAHRETIGSDDFLALGLIALSYGAALLASSYGFLAVFAAGLALRRVERISSADADPDAERNGGESSAPEGSSVEAGEAAEIHLESEVEHSPQYMARAVLGFSEQLERLGTLGVVLLLGAAFSARYFSADALWFVLLLFLVIRPVAVLIGLVGTGTHPVHFGLMSWFGIRGIGSIYYLMFAVERGLPDGIGERLSAIVLTTVAASMVVHGVSVTPLMRLYSRWAGHDRAPRR